MVTFSFNLMAIICVIANLFVFLLTKNDIIEYYNKFPNLGSCNLKGPRAPSQNCKKNPWPYGVCVCRGGGGDLVFSFFLEYNK